MLSLALGSLSFQAPLTSRVSPRAGEPAMVSRREVFTSVAGAAAMMPLSANALYDNGQNKAKGVFGQKVLALTDASAETIADNSAVIETYVSQMIRATGKRNVDGRRLGGTPLGDQAVAAVSAAKAGDKAAANAAVKQIVAMTKLTKVAPLGTKDNPFPGGVSFSSLSGTTGTPGSW